MSIATKVLVMDLYAVQYAIPARKPKTQNKPQKQTSKPNKQKQTTKNKQQTKTTAKTKQKNTKKWDRNQQWRFMHDDILCVMMIMAPNKKQNRDPRQKHQGPNQRV